MVKPAVMRPRWLFWFIVLVFGASSFAVSAQPRSGAAALFKAAEAGNAAEIRKLLAQGVPVDAADSDGWTALMLAAGEGKLAAVQALVKGGADVNWAAKGGETALIVATASGHTAVVKYLLSEGADKTARTKQGLTAADVAARAKKPELAKLLQVGGARAAAGASARAGDSRGEIDAKINAAAEAFKAGRNDEAAMLFQEVVARDPQNAMAWHFLGQSLAAAGRKDEARAAYEKSLALQPSGTLAERNAALMERLRTAIARNVGIQIPEDVEDGVRVPLKVVIDPPLQAGNSLDVKVNGQTAFKVTLQEGQLSGFSSAIMINSDNGAVSVDCNGCGTAARSVRVQKRALALHTANSKPQSLRARVQESEIQVLVAAQSTEAGQLMVDGDGFKATVGLTKYLVSNPIFGLTGSIRKQMHCVKFISDGEMTQCAQ